MRLIVTLIALTTPLLTLSSFEYTLSAVAIFQNEARFMKEWIEYHRLVGVEHFYLYDNASQDDYHIVLNPYIEAGIVELFDWSTGPCDVTHFLHHVQGRAYDDALHRSRGISKWLAIIDLDEFIVPVTYDSVSEMLDKDYPNVSGLRINWQCFGTSGVKQVASGELMIEKLTRKMPPSYHWHQIVKVIVQPLHVARSDGPHECVYNEGHWSVDPNFGDRKVVGEKILIDKIRINHYWTRDLKHLTEVKEPRYAAWGDKSNLNGQSLYGHAAMMESDEDLEIHRFVDRLKERMLN